MKKKNAVMLADTRTALVGQMLIQLRKTNQNVFDEVIVVDIGLSEQEKRLMKTIMPCRFLKYQSPISKEFLQMEKFQRFSLIMFARYEMFRLISEYESIMWLDTDMVIRGSLQELLNETEGHGFSMLREDPENKSAKNEDYMRTNFFRAVPGYQMDSYLYCTGMIIVRDCLEQQCDYTKWCYDKTIEWADNLNLPDQGVMNALIQEFGFPVKPIGHGGKYGCFPYVGRDCRNAVVVHSWGSNKFWNSWYLNQTFPEWEECYKEWVERGGTPLKRSLIPEVSVVIPVYKPDIGYFRQCIDSLMEQRLNDYESYSNFEVVIVSEPEGRENIEKFVSSYHDCRLRLYFNDKRMGIAASLNRGFREAKGTYIARLDDDDIAAPERLQKQAKYLREHPEVALCTSDYFYFGDMNDGRVALEGEMARAWSVLTCPFDHPTIMLRKDFFFENDLFYDEKRGYVEDWELWQRAFQKGMRVGCIHDILLYHRWHNGSAGQTNKTVEMMREMVQKNFRELDVHVPNEDLHLLSPWNGRLTEETDIQKLENYFSQAMQSNLRKNIYDPLCLAHAFSMRLSEARGGGLAELTIYRAAEKDHSLQSAEPIPQPLRKESRLKAFFKKLLKPLYRPFRHRYEDRIIAIQESGWAIEGHVLNCITKLDQIIAAQQRQIEQLQRELSQTQTAVETLISKQMLAAQAELSAKLFTEAENTRQVLSSKVFTEAENTRQELSAKLFTEAENTRQELATRIYTETGSMRKEEKQLFDTVLGRVVTVGDHLYDVKQALRFQQSMVLAEQAGGPRIFLIGTPEHSNIGDAAITLGEWAFFHRFFPESNIIELSTYDFDQWYGKIINMIETDDWIFLQGGGNLGNRFLQEERVRRKVISDLPSNRIVVMPQTIYFDDDEAGRRELAVSQEIYNRHEHLTICTRGLQSMAFAKEHFVNVRIVNSLDMALMLSYKFNRARNGALLCLRDLDDESGLDSTSYDEVVEIVKKRFPDCLMTNNLNKGDLEANIFRDMRRIVVTAELEKFASSQVVVTDRLHGLIFAIITGTPCVVLSAYNQKIEEFSQFFQNSNGVFFIGRNLRLLEENIEKALKVTDPDYPILAGDYFEKLYRAIRDEENSPFFD